MAINSKENLFLWVIQDNLRYHGCMKVILIILVAFLALIFLADSIFKVAYPYPSKIKYGVTFSPKSANDLKLDWQEIYPKILDDLKVKNLRLPAYWDVLQADESNDDYSGVDFMLAEAGRRQAKVILVLGARQPRWPECHIPDWVKKLSVKDRQEKTLQFITKVVERYQNNPAVWAWQVENEPLLASFGEGCDPPDKDFLRAEVELVRKLNSKSIIVTDSGELGFWITPMELSDIFGTTLYRKVYDKTFGYVTYPLPPYFYSLKSTIVRAIFAKNNQKTIITELQAEPWSPNNDFKNMPIAQQLSLFSVDEFRKNITYAQKTGFDTAYIWGVEWWYFMEKMGHPQYLDYAKKVFK
ncbi:beta-galactosidase [Candidatus Daviesbacteria bacterium]|nr:beta-galactosidase [Candidatus Daviesbacteria bacterium]